MNETHKNLMQVAYESAPETMEKVAAMTFLLGKLDKEYEAECARDFNAILEKASSGLEKVSADLTPWRAVGLAAGASVVGALGTAISSDLYDAARRTLSKGSNFRRILKNNPELLQRHDMPELRKAFNAIHTFGPEFTADPTLGGQLLFAATNNKEMLPTMMKDLTSNRKNLLEAKRKQFEPRFNLDEAYTSALERNQRTSDKKEDRAARLSERAEDLANRRSEKATDIKTRRHEQSATRRHQYKLEDYKHSLREGVGELP